MTTYPIQGPGCGLAITLCTTYLTSRPACLSETGLWLMRRIYEVQMRSNEWALKVHPAAAADLAFKPGGEDWRPPTTEFRENSGGKKQTGCCPSAATLDRNSHFQLNNIQPPEIHADGDWFSWLSSPSLSNSTMVNAAADASSSRHFKKKPETSPLLGASRYHVRIGGGSWKSRCSKGGYENFMLQISPKCGQGGEGKKIRKFSECH